MKTNDCASSLLFSACCFIFGLSCFFFAQFSQTTSFTFTHTGSLPPLLLPPPLHLNAFGSVVPPPYCVKVCFLTARCHLSPPFLRAFSLFHVYIYFFFRSCALHLFRTYARPCNCSLQWPLRWVCCSRDESQGNGVSSVVKSIFPSTSSSDRAELYTSLPCHPHPPG